VLLPQTDTAGARTIAERLCAAISRIVVEHDGFSLHTTASIGVASFPEHARGDLRVLLRKADEALYRAKRAGRNRVFAPAA
jgi:diguanylate cyclase (GGDEF)-like protein